MSTAGNDAHVKHVRVTLTARGREAEIHPMYDVLANAPFVERATALQWNFTGDALGILHYVEGDVDAFEAALVDVAPVVDYALEPVGERAFYAYVLDATTDALRDLFAPASVAGVVVVPPVVYREDGTVTLSVFGPSEAIQAGVEAVPSPVDLDVTEVGGLRGVPAIGESRLSERQREAAVAGVELGYYDVPRRATHEDVAAALDCAPSTAAEHLRKAEAKLVRSMLASS